MTPIALLELFLAYLYTNFTEWWVHRYVLHALGKKQGSFTGQIFGFHWKRHHKYAKKLGYRDPDYSSWFGVNTETVGLTMLTALHAPLASMFPYAYLVLVANSIIYYVVHAYSHRNPDWAKRWLRWHYDHHMGVTQEANYCVTVPLFDYLLKTRVKYDYPGDAGNTGKRVRFRNPPQR